MEHNDVMRQAMEVMRQRINNREILRYADGSYVQYGPEGDTRVSSEGVEFRSIQEIRAGRGF